MNNQAFQALLKFVRVHTPTAICQSDYLYGRYTHLWHSYYGQQTPVFVTRFPAK